MRWILNPATVLLFAGTAPVAAERPNIVLILADDLGWSDLGCQGHPWLETPRLDELAAGGVRFTRAYAAAPICSASRAGLLTGKTPASLHFEFVTKAGAGFQKIAAPLQAPPYPGDLPLGEVTIAEVLRGAGYRTAFFGKWHLNRHHGRYLGWSPTHGPKAQGFEVAEEDFGSHPYSYRKGGAEGTFLDLPDGEFVPDGLTNRAVEFLKQEHDRPFFLMVSHFYVHDPIHTRLKWLHDRYLERIPADHPRRELLAHYGAMVTTLDHHVGEVLDALDDRGLSDSTYVIFTSDNGGHPNYAGNAPLRGSKWNLHEGGIRVPLILRDPNPDHAGTVVGTPVWSLDFFPTLTTIAGAEAVSGLPGRDLLPLMENPGTAEPSAWTERRMTWHFPYYHPETGFAEAPEAIGIDDGVTSKTRPHSAIRAGRWKLLHFYEDGRDELYELTSEIREKDEIPRLHEDKARELHLLLMEDLESSEARLPVAHPTFPKP